MKKSLLKYFAQVTVALALYYVFVIYLDWKWPFIIALVVAAILFLVFNVKNTTNGEPLLELQCNPEKYLEFIEEKYQDDNNQYNLAKSYALLYKGENEEAKTLFKKVDKSSFEEDSKFIPIYIRIEIMFAYYDKDVVTLKNILNVLSVSEEDTTLMKDYIKMYLLLLDERYEEAIKVLMDTIPMQEQRVHIIELEYYLALAYYKFEQIEDAKAIISFVIGKNHPIIFTKLCDELYESIE